MSFKEGQTVQLNTLHASVKGTITKLMHGHAIVCFKSISEGVRLAVKPTGQIVVLGEKGKLEPDWKLLNIGDIEAVPLPDLLVVGESKPIPEWITHEQAEHWMGEYSEDYLDRMIKSGSIKQSVEGLLRASDVLFLREAIPTFAANCERERLMRSEEQAKAQEARRYVERVGQLSGN
jgi:hypothetical protein